MRLCHYKTCDIQANEYIDQNKAIIDQNGISLGREINFPDHCVRYFPWDEFQQGAREGSPETDAMSVVICDFQAESLFAPGGLSDG